ncbi:hypothetical protein [uncultured Parasutterella sp.]|uniref:hypothetical protein n=1 Tax=uncultured Parasutterella sp. TaxID=1263098 RepID=UPI00259932F5|nr:hypothetical protein [uncultured Parasutterella sp.]
MAATPEGKVKKEIKKVLDREDCYFYMVVPCGFSTVGFPDFVCCIPTTITSEMVGKRVGIFGGIEAKASGKVKNTTANQRRALEEIHAAGGLAIVSDNAAFVEDCVTRIKTKADITRSIPSEEEKEWLMK